MSCKEQTPYKVKVILFCCWLLLVQVEKFANIFSRADEMSKEKKLTFFPCLVVTLGRHTKEANSSRVPLSIYTKGKGPG